MAPATVADVNLQLMGTQVAFIGVDFQITLRFSKNSVVRLEPIFAIADTTDDVTVVDPEGIKHGSYQFYGSMVRPLKLYVSTTVY